MLPVLTLAALLSGLTYTGSDYARPIIQQGNNTFVGDYGEVGLDTFQPDYYLRDIYNDGQILTFDLRDIERYPNFISVSVGYDASTDEYLYNFNINYGVNFYMSYILEVGNFSYSESQIPLWENDGYYKQIRISDSYGGEYISHPIYFMYVSDVNNPNTFYDSGYTNGYSDGYTKGNQDGYVEGYTEGATQDETAVAIFSGIISVGLIPINFFLACLNFEVFGINIGAFVSALLTVAIVVIITRMIISGGNGGDK